MINDDSGHEPSDPRRDEILSQFYADLRDVEDPMDLLGAYMATHPVYSAELKDACDLHRRLLNNRAAERSLPDLPKSFGKYEILEEIGQGGCGVVFRARDPHLNREVAIKIAWPSVVDGERFRGELIALGRLEHPNIVRLHDYDCPEGSPWYIVMPLLDVSLYDVLCEMRRIREENPWDPLPELSCTAMSLLDEQAASPAPRRGTTCATPGQYARSVAGLLETLAQAVAYAHARGVFHWDLKPSNVMFQKSADDREQGRWHLIDFGLVAFATHPVSASEEASEPSDSATRETMPRGTPSYMAPEQHRGCPGPGSDVYALGIMLRELLTCEHASSYRSPVTPGAADAGPPPAGKEQQGLSAAVPKDLQAIYLRCVDPEPENRLSAKELADELARYRDGRFVRCRSYRPHEWIARFVGRYRFASSLVLLLVVLAAGFLGYSHLSRVRERQLRHVAESGRREADRQRGIAENERHRSEAVQTKYAYELAGAAIRDRRLVRARRFLRGVPPSMVSWDTHWLQHQAQLRPDLLMVLHDGYWGIVDAAVSPDQRLIASADSSGRLLIWDAQTGKAVRATKTGRRSSREPVWLHHLQERSPNSTPLDWGFCAGALCWLDDERLAVASLDGRGLIYSADTGEFQELLSRDETQSPLVAVGASSDATRVAFGAADGTVYLRSAGSDKVRAEHRPPLNDDAEKGETHRAVVGVRWSEPLGQWVAIWQDGRGRLLDGDTFQPVGSLPDCPDAVTCVDVGSAGDDVARVVVCCKGPKIVMFDIDAAESGKVRKLRAALPGQEATPERIDTVRLLEDGKLGLITSGGFLVVLEQPAVALGHNGSDGEDSTSALRQCWDCRVVSEIRLVRPESGVPKSLDPAAPVPVPMQRFGTVLATVGRGEKSRLLTAGADGALKLWNTQGLAIAGPSRLAVQVGREPRIIFDGRRQHLLWCLDLQGKLTLVDSFTGEQVDQRSAHRGGAADIVSRGGGTETVVTVGGDRHVRFWHAADGKIASARDALVSDTPLMGVGASADGRRIATVDTSGVLRVVDLNDGKEVFRSVLGGASLGRPATGRVAFSPHDDDPLLAACGPGHNCPVFRAAPFEGPLEQAWVSGTGGTALAWSPTVSGVLFAGDDYPRYQVHRYGRHGGKIDFSDIGQPLSPCVSIEVTPDGRRFVSLERKGRILVSDTSNLIRLLELRSTLGTVSDVAVDAHNRCLAVSGANGRIEIWDARLFRPSSPPPADDETDAWTWQDMIEPGSANLCTSTRLVQVDPRGRPCCLVVKSSERHFRGEGPLFFVRHDGERTIQERIAVDGTTADERIDNGATALAFQADGEPIVLFRRRLADGGYDGEIHLATRDHSGDWNLEKIQSHGNEGFYATIAVDSNSRASDLFYFRFSRFSLIHATPPPDGQTEWTTQVVGELGDGLSLCGSGTPGGAYHFAFRRARFNGDPAPSLYARWDGKQLHREVIGPTVSMVNKILCLPDGRPVVLAHHYTNTDATYRTSLLVRDKHTWRPLCRLPEAAIPLRRDVTIGSDGRVLLVTMQPDGSDVRLWQYENENWSVATVAKRLPAGAPAILLVRERNGQVLIIAGRPNAPGGWLGVLRRGDRR